MAVVLTMKRLLPLLALFAMLLDADGTTTETHGSQGWWLRSGIVVPTAVGSHIHLDATIVRDGFPVDGRLDIPATVTLHNAAGTTSWVRAGTESQTLFQQALKLGPCIDCSAAVAVSLDLSVVPTGRHEIRISANIPDEDPGLTGSQRFFQTWNAQLCVRACSPTYRAAGPAIESRSWYQDHNYQNAKLTTALSSIRSGGTIGVRLGPGSSGLPTKFAGVYIDPDFHAGSAGLVVRTWSAAFTGSVTLPSLASGSHRLVLLSSDGNNAGVLSVPWVQP
jgi:hypothetical protein